MNRQRKTSVFLMGVFVLALPMATRAQDEPKLAPPDPAYSELAQAAALIKESKTLNAATEAGATLTQKRQALSEKPVAQALELLRDWLASPTIPTQDLDFGAEGIFPLLSGARQLGRALMVRQYVLLADGRVGEAIETSRDALRLAYALQSHSLIGWLTGAAIESLATMTLTRHLDQLSARDCDRLLRLARDWNDAPELFSAALERERKGALLQLRKGFSGEGNPATQPPPEAKQMQERTEAYINEAYAQAQIDLKTPYWERIKQPAPKTKPDAPKEVGTVLTEMLSPVLHQAMDSATKRQTRARLLGCHAAIRRYRWEYNRLPGSLAELKLSAMAIDPFSGKEFTYTPSNKDYTLESVGPFARDENGVIQADRRAPVSITEKK